MTRVYPFVILNVTCYAVSCSFLNLSFSDVLYLAVANCFRSAYKLVI